MSEQEEKLHQPSIGEYKGKPVITLNPQDRFPFTFGVSKAKLIMQHLEDIRAFIVQYGNKE